MHFEVKPQALASQAPRIAQQASQLGEVAGQIRGLGSVAGATGSSEAGAAASRFVDVWSQTVLLTGEIVAVLAANTGEAAVAYTIVDANAMPASGPGGR